MPNKNVSSSRDESLSEDKHPRGTTVGDYANPCANRRYLSTQFVQLAVDVVINVWALAVVQRFGAKITRNILSALIRVDDCDTRTFTFDGRRYFVENSRTVIKQYVLRELYGR